MQWLGKIIIGLAEDADTASDDAGSTFRRVISPPTTPPVLAEIVSMSRSLTGGPSISWNREEVASGDGV
jgi:hypothetical protein